MKPKIIQQGAEANIIKSNGFIIKDRVVKGYRIKEMDDAIRRRRTRREGKLLVKAGGLIAVPKVLEVDEKTAEIDMEFIQGKKLSEDLDSMKEGKEVCFEIGKNIGKLHDADIIHGDLTTSNMIWVDGKLEGEKLDSTSPMDITRSARSINDKTDSGATVDGEIKWKVVSDDNKRRDGGAIDGMLYFIDFGLGFSNGRVEDKAVDLHLIKQALEAKHFKRFEEYFKAVLRGYEESENYDRVMKQLEKVERRGRYKAQY